MERTNHPTAESVYVNEVWLKSNEVMELLNTTRKTIRAWRIKNKITARPAAGGKGGGFEYLLGSLPDEAQRKWTQPAAESAEGSKQLATSKKEENNLNELTAKQEKIALARVDLIKEYLSFTRKEKGLFLDNQFKFADAYNNGAYPAIRKILKEKLSRGTIERWKLAYFGADKDYRVLAPRYRLNKATQVTPEQAKILLKIALNPNKPLIDEVIRRATNRFEVEGVGAVLSTVTYRRFLKRWKAKNYDQWVFYRDGAKALNDRVVPSIPRDYDRINVGDILVGDGHVLNFDILNPFTGKPKRMMMPLFFDMKSAMPLGWEISPTENVQSIAMALYRSLLRLGKIPKIVYLDNGKAFKAKYFQGTDFRQCGLIGLFERLGIEVITAWPYHGQSKTIERFFKTFGELERMMPTYTGTSIELQPPRMNRGEVLHRKLHERINEKISYDLLTAHRAVAWWFDQYSSRQHNGQLNGKRPVEVFETGKGPGIDRQQLTYLMMKEDVAQIYNNGIRFLGDYYWGDPLYGLKDKVVIRYDLLDDAAIYVYDTTGNFICTAYKREKMHPAAGLLGTSADVMKLELAIKHKRDLVKSTTTDAREFLLTEVYPAAQQQLINANILQLEENALTEQQKIEFEVKKTGTDNVPIEMLKSTNKKHSDEERDWF